MFRISWMAFGRSDTEFKMIPFGGLTPDQMDALAEVADEYSDGILHITTRQDFQLHFIHIEDTPTLFRRLAAVGITTQEAALRTGSARAAGGGPGRR